MVSSKTPEILAPVGDWNMLRAAVHNGADAVYIGMPGFNARGRAPTLEVDELGGMIEYARLYGVKVFLAFNILIFEREIPAAIDALRHIIPLRPDAFIVQDLGLVRLIKALAPQQEVHASTQMTITNTEAIRLTEDLGIRRYVLGREVSLSEMEKIRSGTEKELEVFVHGALCVSYSGQCLTSESMGGRSANRGQCAQSCRLTYDLVVDGVVKKRGPDGYLVSPQDLCGLNDVPRLVKMGIDSFKIEGRLKSPAYVASTARAYKKRSLGELSQQDTVEAERDMARIYSRGFFNGWFDGVNHQRLVDPAISSHHGLELGAVRGVDRRAVMIESIEPILAGDGLAFRDPVSGEEFGGSVFGAERVGSAWRVVFGRESSACERVTVGMRVFLNSSPKIEAEYERSYLDKGQLKKIPISIEVGGAIGEQLIVKATDADGNSVTSQSESVLEPAKNSPMSNESLRAELGALAGTVFTLGNLSSSLRESCFLNSRELKAIRRTFTEGLVAQRRAGLAQSQTVIELATSDLLDQRLDTARLSLVPQDSKGKISSSAQSLQHPELNLLVREFDQLSDLKGLPLDAVYLDFEFGKEYGSAVEIVRAMGYRAGIATTRILKPGELAHLKVIERIRPDRILVRNLGALEYLREKGHELIGDFSLNTTNALTAKWLLSKGLKRLSPSYDLNSEQLMDLLVASDPGCFEVTLHHYIPAFHMEHCVFAAFLSTGSSYRDCGRPCERHRVELRDTKGAMHPLKADAECRNTMFNGVPQTAVRLMADLISKGISSLRIEALFDTSASIRRKVELYAALMKGEAQLGDVVSALGAVERYGVTDGQLYSIRGYTDRKKEFTPREKLLGVADPGLV